MALARLLSRGQRGMDAYEVIAEVYLTGGLPSFTISGLPAAAVRAAFTAQTWVGDPSFAWVADWWAGIERMQPGSAGATQAQERKLEKQDVGLTGCRIDR